MVSAEASRKFRHSLNLSGPIRSRWSGASVQSGQSRAETLGEEREMKVEDKGDEKVVGDEEHPPWFPLGDEENKEPRVRVKLHRRKPRTRPPTRQRHRRNCSR